MWSLLSLGGLALGGFAVGGVAVGWWRQAAVPLVCTPWAARPLLPVAVDAAGGACPVGRMQMQAWLSPEATKMQDVAAYLTANCPGLCPALRWLLSLGRREALRHSVLPRR